TLNLLTGLPNIPRDGAIEGRGATARRGAAATTDFSVFAVTQGGNLTLNDTTVSGGVAQYGGGVYISGARLTLNRCTISGNTATGGGGGVANNRGTLTVNDSTVSGNSAGANGQGGAGLFSNGAATLNSSTVSGNFSGRSGGGLTCTDDSSFNIRNSTISGNSAGYEGGGIFNTGTMTLTNSTVTGNSAAVKGGGLRSFYQSATLIQSLVSGNSAPSGPEVFQGHPTFPGTLVADDFNLFGHSGNSGVSGFVPGATDIVPSEASIAILDPLADNDGPTPTHALVAGSPAIDRYTCSGIADQRGIARPEDGDASESATECDVGAYEVGEPNDMDLAITKTSSVITATVSDPVTFTLAVSNAGPDRAAEANVFDTLPAGFSLVLATPTQGTCLEYPVRTVTCRLGGLAANGNASVSLATTATANGAYTNTASVISREVIDVDSDADNDESSVSVTVVAASPGTVQLSGPTFSVGEAGPTASVTMTRTGGSAGAASVKLSTSNDTATAGSDYTAVLNQSVTWGNGDAATKTVTIAINDDALVEGTERFNVALAGASGAALGSQATASLSITDNDVADTAPNPFTFTDKIGVAPGSQQTSNAVTITGINVPATISVSGGTYSIGCTASFTGMMGSINNNQTVCVRHTASGSANTAVNTTLAVGGSTSDTFTSTTLAAPTLPAISIKDASAPEGNSGTTKFRFKVGLSADATRPVTVAYSIVKGTARSGKDYTGKKGKVTFQPGTDTMQIQVMVKGERVREGNETFFVKLSSPSGATITDNQATGTILNDD
ncbi:MAG: Calx-beta domain-containing protein, partial [Panacagrimonas sp.]